MTLNITRKTLLILTSIILVSGSVGYMIGHGTGTTIVVNRNNGGNYDVVKNCTPIFYYAPGSPYSPFVPPQYRNASYIIYSCRVGK